MRHRNAGGHWPHAAREVRAVRRAPCTVRMACAPLAVAARSAAQGAARRAAPSLPTRTRAAAPHHPRRSRGGTRCCVQGGGRLALADAPASVWSAKPPWCQPWTIVGSGVGAVGATDAIFHWWLLTAAVAAVVAAWWYLFLGVYGSQYEEALRAARTGDKRAEEWVLGLLESFAYEGAAQQERAAERSQQQR